MMRSEAKPTARSTARSPSSWKRGNVGCGLIFGFLLVLLYLIVSAQFSYNPHDAAYAGGATTINVADDALPAKRQGSHREQDVGERGMEEERRRSEEARAHTEPSTTARLKEEREEGVREWADKNPIEEQSGHERNSDNWEETQQPKEKDTVEFTEFGGGTDDFNNVAHARPVCDTSFGKYDVCELTGDVRARGGAAATVTLVSPRAPLREWTIKPYSRKYLDGLKSVTVKSVPSSSPMYAPQCTTRMTIPAMVIELGGLTGNYWHDFTDVLVPLFIGARRFNGEVQLLIVNLLPFWVEKYKMIFAQFTRHEIVDLDRDDGVVRCYPHVTVGYGSRKEFTIDPAVDATGGDYTMVDFTKFLRQAYSLPRHRPIKLNHHHHHQRPRMMIFERTQSRKFLNLHEIVAAAEAAGFAVTVAGRPEASYDEFAREVNSFDAMVGVHGAGLTNCVYLPTGAVLVQVVPYGKLEGIARTDFGDPARDMGLRYIEYSVAAEESSLMDVFGKDHPIVKDPVAVHLSGWGNVAEWYLGKQDVRINIQRFKTVLKQAMDHLQ
ncbi:hypothetical protein PR202_ga16895 [Eleusine coracana subsp. coracana]|uniref:Glycosyltransferase 61 catalytic domain-containing protein n=1 Tax=Eleusine coracana subsp. coracana TaxID=191504 RepID=A0AAV5CP18_ELECO|nr:hypothetical protein PR202_ga16895 [Eleusine coracana subsp. coracana]